MLERFGLPEFVLAFDPGGSRDSFAYSVSTLLHRSIPKYAVLEAGYVPIVEDWSAPQVDGFVGFIRRIEARYAGRIDLVAERYMARGFASWMSEFVGMHLGLLSGIWRRGPVRYIPSAQWKRALAGVREPQGRFPTWWGHHFRGLAPRRQRLKGITHVQDSCAMGFWLYRHEHAVECEP